MDNKASDAFDFSIRFNLFLKFYRCDACFGRRHPNTENLLSLAPIHFDALQILRLQIAMGHLVRCEQLAFDVDGPDLIPPALPNQHGLLVSFRFDTIEQHKFYLFFFYILAAAFTLQRRQVLQDRIQRAPIGPRFRRLHPGPLHRTISLRYLLLD
nr:MAG TPA: hypothetical protein [Bacteriophage sp.]